MTRVLGPNGAPVSVDEAVERFWRRSPGEFEHAAKLLTRVAASLNKAGAGTPMVEACRDAALLLSEVYVVKREGGMIRG